MSDFSNIQSELSARRLDRDATAQRVDSAREQLKNVRRELDQLGRVANANDPEQPARRQALEQQGAELTEQLDEHRANLLQLNEQNIKLLQDLTLLADPVKQIEELNDAFPILLFPLRIETRFMTVSNATGQVKQLWVRVYPDDCQVDSFEEMLSDSEVKSARAFWTEIWKAGGIEDQERGAWKAFVGSHGSGRASWIMKQYTPLNLGAKPPKAKPEDIILVVVSELVLSGPDEAAAHEFWAAFWKANGDAGLEQAALQTLEGKVSQATAATILEKFKPVNIDQEPPSPFSRAGVKVVSVRISFDPNEPAVTKTTSWTRAPKARALPDRLTVLCFNNGVEVKHQVGRPIPENLATGPDPSLSEDEQLQIKDGELVVNEELKWMTDFELAVQVGMGFKIDLTQSEAVNGFERLMILGVRISSDPPEGGQLLESLITNHHHSRHGFGLVPQGSPTNNTEGEGSGYTWTDDPDASFNTLFKGKESFVNSTDSFERRDGEWLANELGIDVEILKPVPNANGRDQGEARAMNTALWPATLGYMMEEMMKPIFSFADTDATRRFFCAYVSGRGPAPAIRVGRQPYGVLPAMAFSRYRPTRILEPPVTFVAAPNLSAGSNYLARLYSILRKMDGDWALMAQGVAHVGVAGNPHQTLLDIIGLHSGSVEYHQRYAESLQQIFNEMMIKFGPFIALPVAIWLSQRGRQILDQLGFIDRDAQVPVLEKFFFGDAALLSGPLIDDVPLSESKPIRNYSTDNKNYIKWLATSSTEAIRMQNFGGNPSPAALLYLMLRHAVLLGQWDAGVRMLETHQLLDAAVARSEPSFLNVQTSNKSAGESKFAHLYRAAPQITGDQTTTIAEHILKPGVLAAAFETRDLREILKALAFLADTPTARLERVFAEHIDCCSYRLDAWKTGIVATRLEEVRNIPASAAPPGVPGAVAGPSKGIYLGAYGWLENVKPENKVLTPVPPLAAELQTMFQAPAQPPLVTDSSNAGYIHAPSLSHAATAAVLKNAYEVNASEGSPETMSVNLSSERVRRALTLLEGVRNGQSLSALLGYAFERGLHDRHNLSEVDKFIYPLRQAFPLVANKLHETKEDNADIRLLEARNVIDGVRLIKHLRDHVKTYPFGLALGTGPGQLPPASPLESSAINGEVDAMLDLNDAVADLMLSETVYQTVVGNVDRAAASAQALGRSKYPPEPEVVITPRSGVALTQRVGLQLDAAANPNASPSTVPMTPRAKAEAAINKWLADHLPAPSDVVCKVVYTSPALSGEKSTEVSQQELGLQPADLLYLANLDLDQAMAELDARITQFVRYENSLDPHPALAIKIQYTEHVTGKTSFFELAPLIKSLRVLLLKSRHLSPADMALAVEAESAKYAYELAELASRINTAITDLTALRDQLAALETVTANVDDYAKQVSELFLSVALHGIPQTGTSDIHDSIRGIYVAILAKIEELTDRWDAKSAEFTTLMATLGSLPTAEERLALLTTAEGLISSNTTVPPPTDPVAYESAVQSLKLTFDNRLQDFKDLLVMNADKLITFIASVETVGATAAAHDAVPFDIADQKNAANTLGADLVVRVRLLKEELTKRLDQATELLAAAADVNEMEGAVSALLQAAVKVLGDETKLLPRFTLLEVQGLELQNCVSSSASLLDHLKNDRGRLFPEDDWLYGLARVREKLRAWENVIFLTEAFGATAPALTPLQLPHLAGDSWLGLEFPEGYKFDSDRLLYSAHFAVPFNPNAPQCGLFIDEWTEIIPGQEEVTGVAFHFDRPNSEPAQVMLLAVPPVLSGHWHWDDLVAMLGETLDDARKRAVEPQQVDNSNYAQFLPATLMAVTLYQMTIATNLAFNNQIYRMIG